MGWGSIYKRRVKVFTLAVVIYLDYKVKLLLSCCHCNVGYNDHNMMIFVGLMYDNNAHFFPSFPMLFLPAGSASEREMGKEFKEG